MGGFPGEGRALQVRLYNTLNRPERAEGWRARLPKPGAVEE
jgi:hypothetical protein